MKGGTGDKATAPQYVQKFQMFHYAGFMSVQIFPAARKTPDIVGSNIF